MQITQLRNATIIVHIGNRHILVDPMLTQVTHCLITHCQKGHYDHLDAFGKKWLRETQLPEGHEAPTPFFEGHLRTVRCTHGEGVVGRMMEHGAGYFIEMPNEPSLYLAGDTILTPRVRDFVRKHQPDVSVVPAGGARFDIGGGIIMGVDDVIAVTQLATGTVVAKPWSCTGGWSLS